MTSPAQITKFQFGVLWLKQFAIPRMAHSIVRELRSHRWSRTNGCEVQTAVTAITDPSDRTQLLSYWIAQEVLFRDFFLKEKINTGWIGRIAKDLGLEYALVCDFLGEMMAEATTIHLGHMKASPTQSKG